MDQRVQSDMAIDVENQRRNNTSKFSQSLIDIDRRKSFGRVTRYKTGCSEASFYESNDSFASARIAMS